MAKDYLPEDEYPFVVLLGTAMASFVFGIGIGVFITRQVYSGAATTPAGGALPAGQVQGATGFYMTWLTHNNSNCNRWNAMNRPQKIQYLRNFIYGSRAPQDPYNTQMRTHMLMSVVGISLFQNGIGAYSVAGVGRSNISQSTNTQTLTGNVLPMNRGIESGLGRLSNIIDADCLRAAVNPNIPHISIR